MSDWTPQDARTTYNVPHWGAGYFDIDAEGHVVVTPRPGRDAAIDLHEVAGELARQHLSWPVLVRFTDILHDRVDLLCNSFQAAMQKAGYGGGYTAVYPVKVNQQHSVVQEIVDHGGERLGLEAGSKPELMAVLGIARPGSVIVCNGYKDREYIRLALLGQQLGHRVFIVIEKSAELELVLEAAAELELRPTLGVRVRLASIGAGKWQNTGGEKSKFGLSAAQVLTLLAQLEACDMLDCLSMLHFHLGSQLVNLRDIQQGLQECGRFYAELQRLGATIETVDVGGGLGVDYEGSHSRSPCSMNYSVQEYAEVIVQSLQRICREQDLPEPHLMSESGRALTAHHAVLITDVVDTEQVPDADSIVAPSDTAPAVVQQLWRQYRLSQAAIDAHRAVEIWHDTEQLMQELQQAFSQGHLALAERAGAEAIFFALCRRLQQALQGAHSRHNAVREQINEKLADKYFVNFSLFQSMPDVWAIEQIFPILPLQRLDEKPTRRGVLEDITCDSDGRIDYYVDSAGVESTLPLHEIRQGETYLLGIFLLGAYQEILGDMHNLFGDTDSIHVRLQQDGSYKFSQALQGDTVDSILRYVHFNPDELLEQYHAKLQASDLDAARRRLIRDELAAGLRGYTYLEKGRGTRDE